MSRTLLVIPVAVVAVAGSGAAICSVLGFNAHLADLLLASTICLVAGVAGSVPVSLTVSNSPAAVFQSAFLGTIVHLALSVVLCGVAIFGLKRGGPFIFWAIGMYWVTLLALCAVFVRRLRLPVEPAGVAAH